MKKFFKRVNIGVVLTIITVAIVVIYSINVEIGRKKDLIEIESVIKKYIGILNETTDLEYDEENLKYITTSDELKTKKEVMKSKLKEVFVQNDKLLEHQIQIIDSDLNVMYENLKTNIIFFETDYIKTQSSEFFENTATIKVSLSHKYNYINNENTVVKETTNIGSDTYVYTFTFKKENGKWKISYSDLSAISFNVLSIDSNIYDNIKVITH